MIGGIPRVGKSTLASLILDRNHVSSLSTDVIRNLLDFSPAKVGIKDVEESKKYEVFFPYLLQFLKIIQNKYSNYVVEGDLFLPVQVSILERDIDVKCCFLGSSNLTLEDLKHQDPGLDWVSRFPLVEQLELPEKFMEKSEMFRQQAVEYNYPYFDIYPDRQSTLEDAYEVLMK